MRNMKRRNMKESVYEQEMFSVHKLSFHRSVNVAGPELLFFGWIRQNVSMQEKNTVIDKTSQRTKQEWANRPPALHDMDSTTLCCQAFPRLSQSSRSACVVKTSCCSSCSEVASNLLIQVRISSLVLYKFWPRSLFTKVHIPQRLLAFS